MICVSTLPEETFLFEATSLMALVYTHSVCVLSGVRWMRGWRGRRLVSGRGWQRAKCLNTGPRCRDGCREEYGEVIAKRPLHPPNHPPPHLILLLLLLSAPPPIRGSALKDSKATLLCLEGKKKRGWGVRRKKS